ncbi:hypothetical protein AAGF08_20400, partial [Algoriphagus sp. SE2]|uniref:hypothetical protein n=1 Tax=Algoriphagus sp. SE2 TaxID=3141536 RepID=UPI0031CDA378
NWNENRKDRIQEQTYLKRLLKELESDSESWRSAIEYTASITNESKIILEQLSTQNVVDTALFVKKTFVVGSQLIRRPYIPTYDELLSSGRLSILQNDSLRTKLRTYMAIFKMWDNQGDYVQWQSDFADYKDHIHQYFSPLILTEIGKAVRVSRDSLISVEKLNSMGLDLSGYLSDKKSLTHLRKITYTHEQLNLVYQNIHETTLLPLIDRIKREIKE